MSDMQIFTGTMTRISETARDKFAAGIWFAVLAGALFLTANGQSILMTAGLMLELTAAYSTFVLCGKPARSLFISFGLSVKARAEENFLTSELDPSAYESYRRRVPMLIPFLPHR